jgi:hypothetical protein
MATKVITYARAYRGAPISLCRRHGSSELSGVSLGQVLHGLHSGACDVCRRRAPCIDGVTLVRDNETDGGYVSSEALPRAVARAAAKTLSAAGWATSTASNDLDAPGLEWLYVALTAK